MNEAKKELIRDVTAIFVSLPPQKQERAIGIMQGMMMAAEEAGSGANVLLANQRDSDERKRA